MAEPVVKLKSGVKDATLLVFLVIREAGRSFFGNRNLESAATLAYYGFLSLMPLLLLVIYLLGVFMKSSEAILSGMEALMAQLFPAFSGDILKDMLTLSRQRVWGLVGIVVLIWSMTPFAGAIRGAMAVIFKSGNLKFLKAKFFDLAAVSVLLLLFLFLAASRVFLVMRTHTGPAQLTAGSSATTAAAALVVTMIVMAFFYLAFSPVRLKFAHLAAGALTAAILLGIIRPLFGMILRFNPDYGYAFGSLKAIFLLIIWVYYTFAVILFGAEIIATARRKDSLLLRKLFIGRAGPRLLLHPLLKRFIRNCGENEMLFKEGDPGGEMYYILSGAVALTKHGRELRRMQTGEYFGEMSMLIATPRTATAAAAVPDTTLIAVSQANFETIMRESPEFVQLLLKEMAARLQTTTDQLPSGK